MAQSEEPGECRPLELLLPPDTMTPDDFFWRLSKMWVEWAQLIVERPSGRPELARRVARLAVARALALARDVRRRAGDVRGALQATRAALEATPTDAELAFSCAELHVELAELPEAASCLETAITQRPLGRNEARVLYGAVLEALGRTADLARLAAETEPLAAFMDVDAA